MRLNAPSVVAHSFMDESLTYVCGWGRVKRWAVGDEWTYLESCICDYLRGHLRDFVFCHKVLSPLAL